MVPFRPEQESQIFRDDLSGLGGTSTVLAVNSYVTNVNCSGVDYSARVDTEAGLDWIGEFFS